VLCPLTFLGDRIKTVAIGCQILRLKFTKFDFGWDSAQDRSRGAYSVPPAGFYGTYFLRAEKEGNGKELKG